MHSSLSTFNTHSLVPLGGEIEIGSRVGITLLTVGDDVSTACDILGLGVGVGGRLDKVGSDTFLSSKSTQR